MLRKGSSILRIDRQGLCLSLLRSISIECPYVWCAVLALHEWCTLPTPTRTSHWTRASWAVLFVQQWGKVRQLLAGIRHTWPPMATNRTLAAFGNTKANRKGTGQLMRLLAANVHVSLGLWDVKNAKKLLICIVLRNKAHRNKKKGLSSSKNTT